MTTEHEPETCETCKRFGDWSNRTVGLERWFNEHDQAGRPVRAQELPGSRELIVVDVVPDFPNTMLGLPIR
jgi:hypothetical protein